MQEVGPSDREDGVPRSLADELGAEPPPAIAALDPQHQAEIAGALHEARSSQARALISVWDNGLRMVPRFLRGPLRKAIGG